MSGFLNLSSINSNELDSSVKSFGNNLNIYFDFKDTKFTAVSLPDKNGNMKVVYSMHHGMCKTYEEKIDKLRESKCKDYSKDIYLMFDECADNYICECEKFSEYTKQICEVLFIPEMRGLCFLTAGYKIGLACAEAIYGEDTSDSVSFYIENSSIYTIDGESLQRVAARFILKDIEHSNNIGYSYYNKSIIDNRGVQICTANRKRFGKGESVRSISSLMRNFTDFIPIGFSWDTYTPFWFRNSKFIDRLRNETVLGYDMIEVPNLSYDGRDLRNANSVTYYTTRRRLYDVFSLTFECYNYKFINEIIAGLFFNGLFFINPNFVAKGNKGNSDVITPMKYYSYNESDLGEFGYVVIEDDNIKKIPSVLFLSKYWKTMDSELLKDSVVGKDLISILSNLSFDGVLAISEDREIDYKLFNYVK